MNKWIVVDDCRISVKNIIRYMRYQNDVLIYFSDGGSTTLMLNDDDASEVIIRLDKFFNVEKVC